MMIVIDRDGTGRASKKDLTIKLKDSKAVKREAAVFLMYSGDW